MELNQKTLDALQVLVNTVNGESAPEEPTPAKLTRSKAQKPKADPLADSPELDPEPASVPKEDDDTPITMTEVRAEALKLSKAGKQSTLKEIFAKYDNATKLSDISENSYPALMTDLRSANG